jgi:hypothetical protein
MIGSQFPGMDANHQELCFDRAFQRPVMLVTPGASCRSRLFETVKIFDFTSPCPHS